MTHAKCYRAHYPRPQFVRDSYIDLNGTWDFAFDDEKRGEQDGWYRNFSSVKKICVPFSYHTKASGIGETARHDCVWYRRPLPFSRKDLAGKRAIVNFEGCDYYTKVWVNGSYAGSHCGGYDRFSMDITDLLGEGENILTVRAEDSFDTRAARGKQRWQENSFACFYVETTGIWKSVWCEFVPAETLQRVKITPDVDASSVSVEYEISGFSEELSVRTVISFGGSVLTDTESRVTRNVFRQDFSLISEVCFFKVFHWEPLAPHLYDVEIEVKKNGGVVDKIGTYFGMRKVECARNRFQINNRPEYLRMVLDQGYWKDSELTPPSEESLKRDVELMKELNFNGVRVHEKVEEELFYYYCDVLGLYATFEMPSNYEYSEAGSEQFLLEWMRLVRQFHNHPSLICWIPFNESWGIFNVYENPSQQSFTESAYFAAKTLDGTRPIISNDGWEHTRSDIVTLHNYAETGENLTDCYGNLNEILTDTAVKTAIPKSTFAKGYEYEGQPVMITEYGGVAFQKDCKDGWGYGMAVKNEEEFLKRLRGLTQAIVKMPGISGYCVTQLTDVQQEKNGLLDIDRNFKADKEKLRVVFTD